MRPKVEYIRRLLLAFEDAESPTLTIEDLVKLDFSSETDELGFHMRLLHDQGFVERADEKPGLGIDQHVWFPVPLRLTASGHDFAAAMGNSKAFAVVKKSAGSLGIAIMRDMVVTAFKAELIHLGAHLG